LEECDVHSNSIEEYEVDNKGYKVSLPLTQIYPESMKQEKRAHSMQNRTIPRLCESKKETEII
jgi:hypothetical protein